MIIPIFSHADGLQIHVYTYKQNRKSYGIHLIHCDITHRIVNIHENVLFCVSIVQPLFGCKTTG